MTALVFLATLLVQVTQSSTIADAQSRGNSGHQVYFDQSLELADATNSSIRPPSAEARRELQPATERAGPGGDHSTAPAGPVPPTTGAAPGGDKPVPIDTSKIPTNSAPPATATIPSGGAQSVTFSKEARANRGPPTAAGPTISGGDIAAWALVFVTLVLGYFAFSTDRTYKSIDATYKVIAAIASQMQSISDEQTNLLKQQTNIMREQVATAQRQTEIAERQARALSALNQPIFRVRKETNRENEVITESLVVENVGARVPLADVRLATVFEIEFWQKGHGIISRPLGTRFYFPSYSRTTMAPEIWRTWSSNYVSSVNALQRFDHKIGVYSVAATLHHYIDVEYCTLEGISGHQYFCDGVEITEIDAKKGFDAVKGNCFDFGDPGRPLDVERLWDTVEQLAPEPG